MPAPPMPSLAASMLDWALWYGAMGWPVFPCQGKRPLTTHGLHEASTDPDQITAWWTTTPFANIGCALSERHWALDVDARHAGLDTLHDLEQTYTPLPRTVTNLTGSGGGSCHLLWSGTATNKAKLGPGLDVQGSGAYIILPPSIHPDTHEPYCWEADFGPDDLDIQTPPNWLDALVNATPRQVSTDLHAPDSPILEGQREATLMRMAGAMRRHGATFETVLAALEVENGKCVPPLDGEALLRMAKSVQRYTPVVEGNGQGDGASPKSEADPHVLDTQKLLTLVLNHPHIQPALKRNADTDDAKHARYDAMLAEAGLKDAWAEADIMALICAGRTRNGRPAPPEAYCRLTMQEASVREKTGDIELSREALLANLSDIWGLTLTAVIRHGTENALWHLRLSDGREIQIGTSKDLLSQAHVRTQIYDVTGKVIPRYKPSEARLWDHHMEILALVAVTVDTPEMTRLGQARAFVVGYLEAQHYTLDHDTDEEEWEELALGNRPYLRQGMLYLSARHLWMHYVRIVAPKMLQTELLDLLRLLGGRRITITLRNEKKTSRSLWRLPPRSLVEASSGEESAQTGRELKTTMELST